MQFDLQATNVDVLATYNPPAVPLPNISKRDPLLAECLEVDARYNLIRFKT